MVGLVGADGRLERLPTVCTRNWKRQVKSAQEFLATGKQARADGRSEEANAFFELSLAAAEKLGDRAGMAAALFTLGENAICIDNDPSEHAFDKRRRFAGEAQRVFAELGDEQGIVRCLVLKATVARTKQEQKQLIDESFAIAERIGYQQGIVLAKVRLAAYISLDDRARAAEIVAEAIDLAKEIGDEPATIHALKAMTSFPEDTTRRRAAFEDLQAIYRKNGEQRQLIEMLMWCAALGCEDDDFDRQETYVNEALAVATAIGSAKDEASCLLRLSHIARGRGDLQKADELEAASRSLWDIPMPPPIPDSVGKTGIVSALIEVIWGKPKGGSFFSK